MDDNELIELVEKNSKTLEQWFALMLYGVETFKKKPLLAVELIVREAERRRVNCPQHWTTADVVMELMRRLEWSFSISG